jgi:hypothetical protein
MADRYWVGGTDTWNATAGTKWALTSGGAGGQAVPNSSDNVFFDAASGVVTVTLGITADCLNFDCTGFTGTITGTSTIQPRGSFTLNSAMTWLATGNVNPLASAGSHTITTAGKTLGANLNFGLNGGTAIWTLQNALTVNGTLTVTYGTFTTNDYNVTAASLSSSNSNTRTINLGSSTVTLTSTPITFTTSTGLTFNAGTSSIVCSQAGPLFNGGGQTFYNVSFTNNNSSVTTVNGENTFNNWSITGRTNAGLNQVSLGANQTINGTLTLSAGTNATMRTFVRSNTIGTTRTLTCAAVASLTDIDFRDITIAGAAAPVSGTRLGDCKGNSGIAFPAAKTVFWRLPSGAEWGTNTGNGGWSDTNGGTTAYANFPLAQDTAVFPSSPTPYPSSGNTVTINAAYNIGTIDMSARTSNTMTLATGTTQPQIYGNWINGTGTTVTGTSTPITFAGRGSQTITSAGKTFTQGFAIETPGGSVTLQDAFTTNRNAVTSFALNSGTLDMAGYNFTLSGAASRFVTTGDAAKTLAVGAGTLTIAGDGGFLGQTNLTVTGTGTINLTSASAKTFAGGGIQTYPTLNQGGTGTLTVTGSNKFAGLTNTAIGRIQFTGGTTNEFTSFTISGALGNLLQLGSTNTTQAILQKPTAWNMGVLSTDAGNNTGLNFLSNDGTMEYLSVSYINGQVVAPPSSYLGNFFAFF